jgi:hypothetical protein
VQAVRADKGRPGSVGVVNPAEVPGKGGPLERELHRLDRRGDKCRRLLEGRGLFVERLDQPRVYRRAIQWQVGGAVIAGRPDIGTAGANGVVRVGARIAVTGDTIGSSSPLAEPAVAVSVLDQRCGCGDLAEWASVHD